ncbi:MAG: OmpA family protein [Pseudomonadota bacterium]
MRHFILGLAASLCAIPALAVNTDTYQIPYFGLGGLGFIGDDSRKTEFGIGYSIHFGMPFGAEGKNAIELTLTESQFKRDVDGKENFASTIFADYVRNFGMTDFLGLPAFKPYYLVGAGITREDAFAKETYHVGANAGAGLFFPMRFRGWGIRTEGRVQYQANDATVTDESGLLDYKVGASLQIPLTVFFDREVPVTPVLDCEVAVVDPVTGRRDCAIDSDRDGVLDPQDQCPGTPPATPVDAVGCPEGPKTNDADGDGVLDESDKCPGTAKDLKVDGDGCVVSQNMSIYSVTFLSDSAVLTDEARAVLDGAAITLNTQSNIVMEVAGHTDNIGSPAYNRVLSQQRADAVREYLVSKGVGESRMTAAGYGDTQPVASNDSEIGRAQNRRVEFRIVVSP